MKRAIALLLLVCAVMMLASGCELPGKAAQPKTFQKDGLQIELTDAFTESENSTYNAYYASSEMAVYTLRQDMGMFTGGDVEVDVEFYLELVMESNGITAQVRQSDALQYFVFQKTVYNTPYTYYAFGYQTEDAFWLVQLCCVSKDAEKLEETILQYASSIKFS